MRAVILVTLLALSACGTVAGFGQDLSSGADRVKGWMD